LRCFGYNFLTTNARRPIKPEFSPAFLKKRYKNCPLRLGSRARWRN